MSLILGNSTYTRHLVVVHKQTTMYRLIILSISTSRSISFFLSLYGLSLVTALEGQI